MEDNAMGQKLAKRIVEEEKCEEQTSGAQ